MEYWSSPGKAPGDDQPKSQVENFLKKNAKNACILFQNDYNYKCKVKVR